MLLDGFTSAGVEGLGSVLLFSVDGFILAEVPNREFPVLLPVLLPHALVFTALPPPPAKEAAGVGETLPLLPAF